MPTSLSRLSFEDCFDILNQAADDGSGVRVAFAREGDATHFRMRCNAARAMDRKENAETYEQGHVLFGRSVYDNIVIRLVREVTQTFLYFEKRNAEMKVTKLSELTEDTFTPPVRPEPKLEAKGATAVQERKIERRI